MKVLNLYAGIGGNRKLWGGVNMEITAVELDTEIAKIYSELYPNDTVIIGDAHEYLLKHFREYDFIWASPPCPTHSVLQMCNYHKPENIKYADMTLYQEIVLLKTFYKCMWVIENVTPYYQPLIEPTFKIDRHLFWSSAYIWNYQTDSNCYDSIRDNNKAMAEAYGFDIDFLKRFDVDVRKILRNCVKPEIGKYIFEKVTGVKHV